MTYIYRYEDLILFGIIIGVIILLGIIAAILDHFFPKNKFFKILARISEWISDNLRI